jgi:hypothetical protein
MVEKKILFWFSDVNNRREKSTKSCDLQKNCFARVKLN